MAVLLVVLMIAMASVLLRLVWLWVVAAMAVNE